MPAATRLRTGSAKAGRHFGKCATNRQHSGIVNAPTAKAHEAIWIPGVSLFTDWNVKKKSRFRIASPKNEM
jgi:hypothetical protein